MAVTMSVLDIAFSLLAREINWLETFFIEQELSKTLWEISLLAREINWLETVLNFIDLVGFPVTGETGNSLLAREINWLETP